LHSWTSRPLWPQGVRLPDHSKAIPVVPPTLDWDLWLGVAEPRAYDPAYLPFNWRGYWDFGTGAIGDMGCHLLDGAWWALDLGAPSAVESVSAKHSPFGPPAAAMITYEFPARGPKPAVKWTWYEGGLQPTLAPWFEAGRRLPDNGTFIVGSNAVALAEMTYQSIRLVPEARMREFASSLPPKSLPRVPNGDHFVEWTRACKTGELPGANFDYASRLTETVLVANLALRTRRRIEWDTSTRQVTNLPSANPFLAKPYRAGFGV
jgi:predicted dehydrogenase